MDASTVRSTLSTCVNSYNCTRNSRKRRRKPPVRPLRRTATARTPMTTRPARTNATLTPTWKCASKWKERKKRTWSDTWSAKPSNSTRTTATTTTTTTTTPTTTVSTSLDHTALPTERPSTLVSLWIRLAASRPRVVSTRNSITESPFHTPLLRWLRWTAFLAENQKRMMATTTTTTTITTVIITMARGEPATPVNDEVRPFVRFVRLTTMMARELHTP
mmetsp:Transcript_18475/g.31566  ORF Transcript_18475/g.31566 Transcript_18475/m.31566 type:complete len:219 (+) Transcript_18475:313-969(+)